MSANVGDLTAEDMGGPPLVEAGGGGRRRWAGSAAAGWAAQGKGRAVHFTRPCRSTPAATPLPLPLTEQELVCSRFLAPWRGLVGWEASPRFSCLPASPSIQASCWRTATSFMGNVTAPVSGV